MGLAKVASTFLQNSIFPKFKGVYFIRKLAYRQDRKIIARTKRPRYLLSREFDYFLEKKLRTFAEDYPGAKTIIILRRHDSWIASEYRKYVKNGGRLSFDQYFNLDNTAKIKTDELYFMDKIKTLEKLFGTKPLVMFYDDLKIDPWAFIDKIAGFSGAKYNKKDISLKKVHSSYNEKQLKIMRSFARYFIRKNRKWAKNRTLYWIQRRSRLLLSYVILYPSLLIPGAWVCKEELIPSGSLEKIKNFYAGDWNKCMEYAGSGAK